MPYAAGPGQRLRADRVLAETTATTATRAAVPRPPTHQMTMPARCCSASRSVSQGSRRPRRSRPPAAWFRARARGPAGRSPRRARPAPPRRGCALPPGTPRRSTRRGRNRGGQRQGRDDMARVGEERPLEARPEHEADEGEAVTPTTTKGCRDDRSTTRSTASAVSDPDRPVLPRVGRLGSQADRVTDDEQHRHDEQLDENERKVPRQRDAAVRAPPPRWQPRRRASPPPRLRSVQPATRSRRVGGGRAQRHTCRWRRRQGRGGASRSATRPAMTTRLGPRRREPGQRERRRGVRDFLGTGGALRVSAVATPIVAAMTATSTSTRRQNPRPDSSSRRIVQRRCSQPATPSVSSAMALTTTRIP